MVDQNRFSSQRDGRNHAISTPQFAVVRFCAKPEQGDGFGVILSIEHCAFNDATAMKAENPIGNHGDSPLSGAQCRLVYTGVILVKVLGW